MSGFAGILQLDGRPPDLRALGRMQQAMGARLPSEARPIELPPLALVSSSVWSHTGRCVVALDGAIHACAGVRDGCAEEPARLLGAAFEEVGADVCEAVAGTASFLVWDAREGVLHCVRDRVGLTPFYYHLAPGRFAFASSVAGLLALPDVSDELDELRIADHLAMNFEDKEATFHRHVKRLPPSCAMRIGPDRKWTRTYWSLEAVAELPRIQAEDAAQRLRGALLGSVRDCLAPSSPTGLLLSGGLDSASLLGCLRREHEDLPIKTLTVTFPGDTQADERGYVEDALAGSGVEAAWVDANELSPLSRRAEDTRGCDEPVHAANLFVVAALARRARELGVRTLLDGVDGDSAIWHGWERLHELLRRGRWFTLLRESRALSNRLGQSSARTLWRSALRPAFTPLTRRWRGEPPFAPPAVMSPDLARRLDWCSHARACLADHLRTPRSMRAAHLRHLGSGLLAGCGIFAGRPAGGYEMRHALPGRRCSG